MENKKTKKWYKRWWIWLIAAVVIVISLPVIGNSIKHIGEKEIPNVYGINHTDATKVLTEKGFEVTEIEADAESILSTSSIYNRSVKKGEVFKVNDRIDPNPYQFITKDKNIVIYYAKDDYTYIKPEQTNALTTAAAPTTAPTEKASNDTSKNNSNTDFKATMDSYEAFFDEYIAFMKKYKNSNGNNSDLLADYTEYMKKYTDMMQKLNSIDKNSLSSADYEYYMQVQTRIMKKISDSSK